MAIKTWTHEELVSDGLQYRISVAVTTAAWARGMMSLAHWISLDSVTAIKEIPRPLSSPPVMMRVVLFCSEQDERDLMALWCRGRVARQANSFGLLLSLVGDSFQNARWPSVAAVMTMVLFP